MQLTLLTAKIHNCTLTDTNLYYVGSISIDQVLLDTAGILPYEQVQVVNATNGERLMTYAIAAPAHSGTIGLNGAAARLGMVGDRVIIMTYRSFSSAEAADHHPQVMLVDGQNHLLQVLPYQELLDTVTHTNNSKISVPSL